jgi:predicted amino acid dehydrogenase
MERKEQKAREHEAVAICKLTGQMARKSTHEERRCKMLELCLQCDQFAYEPKEAALKRVAKLVASNQVPISDNGGLGTYYSAATCLLAGRQQRCIRVS